VRQLFEELAYRQHQNGAVLLRVLPAIDADRVADDAALVQFPQARPCVRTPSGGLTGSTSVKVTGTLLNGRAFEGSDTINIVKDGCIVR
jgi:hypothetical protein